MYVIDVPDAFLRGTMVEVSPVIGVGRELDEDDVVFHCAQYRPVSLGV